MKNAVWKLGALAGVVGIGFLVMLQVQQGLSRNLQQTESGQHSTDEGASESTDSPSSEGMAAGQQEPARVEEPHEVHAHETGEHDDEFLHQSSGLNFRTGADAQSSRNVAHNSTPARGNQNDPDNKNPFGLESTQEPTQGSPESSAIQTAGLEDDPFAELNPVPTKPAPTASSRSEQKNAIQPTNHEAATEDPSTDTPAAIVDENRNPAGGAGPQLLPAPTSESSEVPKGESGIESADPIEDDPFATEGAKQREDRSGSIDGKPRSFPADEEPSLANNRQTKSLDGATKTPNSRSGNPPSGEENPFSSNGGSSRPGPSLPDRPTPDPNAFGSINENDESETDNFAPENEPKSQLGNTPASSENDPSLSDAVSPFAPQEADNDQVTSSDDEAGPSLGGNAPTSEPAPRVSSTEPGTSADSSRPRNSQAPSRLAAPQDASPLEPARPGDFHGDGTVAGDMHLGPQRPHLTIEKVAPPNAVLGQPLIYSILVKNVGNTTANDVVVEDRIPKGSKLSGTIPRAELADKTLIWKLGNLAPGEQRKISIRVVPLEAGQIGSVATVNFVAEVAAETQITAPQLRIDLAGPREAKLGEPVPFHFRVTNTGNGEASGVVIRDLIPDGLKHAAGDDLEYEVGRLPAGESREIKLALTAAKIGPAVNHAVVTADGGIKSEAKVSVEVYGTKLVVTRTGPTRRYIGRTAIYTNTVTNDSPRPVEVVTVTEAVPEGFEFAEASDGGQFNPGSRTIAWQVNQLGPGESRDLKVKLVPKSTGTLTSVVKAMASGGEPAEVTLQTVVQGFAAIRLEIPTIESPIDVGEKTNLRVVARNRGNSPATNVEVSIEIPEQFKVVSARGPVKYEQTGNQLRFSPIPSIDGRTSAAFDIELEAIDKGDARLRVQVGGDYLDRPIVREESILVLSDG